MLCSLLLHKLFKTLPVLLIMASLFSVRAADHSLFVDNWKFKRGDAEEARWRLTWHNIEPFALVTQNDLLKPESQIKRPNGEPGFGVDWLRENFDDTDWETVNLPHDAAISQPFSYDNEPTQTFLPTSDVVWYRKTFDLAAHDADKLIMFDFNGVMSHCGVWVNGHFAGGWGYGYTTFRIDATPFVKFGAKNVIAVRVANPSQSSRWYSGNGIYRNVRLVKLNRIHVARWGVFVQTPHVSANEATLNVSVCLENSAAMKQGQNGRNQAESPEDVEAEVAVRVFCRDEQGNRVGEPIADLGSRPVSVTAGQKTVLAFSDFRMENPPLWSPESPSTCVAITTVSVNNTIVDIEETPFGIREIEFDPNQGLLVNGRNYKIRGFCLHHDFGALGAAFNLQAEERRLRALKELGCNAIRLSHNPADPETMDLLARLGFLVQAEAFDQWKMPHKGSWRPTGYCDLFDAWSEADLRALVRRDRNCPAVIMWSIGNEIPELSDEPEFVRQARRLVNIVKEEDPTRPVTSACNSRAAGFGEIPRVLDVFGYNYFGRDAYPQFHEKYPDVTVYGSEIVCTITTRGWYVFPFSKKMSECMSDFRHSSYCWTAFGFNAEKPLAGWACPPDVEFEASDRNPFVAGGFAWTGIDYLGAPYHVDEMARSMKFTIPEIEKRALAEKEIYGAPRVPLRICETGIFDTALFPKDIYYLYKSRWQPEEKTLHILPHWNFPNRIGEVTPVTVFTSGDSVELFLNGKSLGRKTKGEYEYRLTWDDVKYEPGTLRAIAWKNNEFWTETTLETTGAPAALRLKPEKKELANNGQELLFTAVEVIDDQDRIVPDAEIEIEFRIEGAGSLLATDSGNACDFVPYSSPKRKTFGGLALAIIQSETNESGTLKIEAIAPGLKPAYVEIPCVTR